MKRRALIIGNPGEEGDENYCSGVLKDLDAYPKFLTEPMGGFWRNDEISVLRQPTVRSLDEHLLRLSQNDYGLVIFTGHGDYVRSEGSTILDLGAGQSIDSRRLIGNTEKQTTIFDCCRKYRRELLFEDVRKAMGIMAKSLAEISPDDCRHYYDKRIEKASAEQIVMWACSINEYSYDDTERGGVYSSALRSVAEEWFVSKRNEVDTTSEFLILSVVRAHELARVQIAGSQSGEHPIQNPQIQKPRSGDYFPFAVIA